MFFSNGVSIGHIYKPMHAAYYFQGQIPLFTDHGSLKITDISYRLRFSFVSFACIVRSFFVFRSFALRSCNCFVRFMYRSFHVSFVSFVRLIGIIHRFSRLMTLLFHTWLHVRLNNNDACILTLTLMTALNYKTWTVQTLKLN